MTTPARVFHTQQIHYLRKSIAYSDTFPVTVGVIPSGATIIKPISGVQVNTAFNAATTNVLDIGESSPTNNDDLYATDLALGAVTFVPLDEAVGLTVSADTTITCTYAQTGTAATAGAGEVVIAYIPDNDG
jgi:hypothetical protein